MKHRICGTRSRPVVHTLWEPNIKNTCTHTKNTPTEITKQHKPMTYSSNAAMIFYKIFYNNFNVKKIQQKQMVIWGILFASVFWGLFFGKGAALYTGLFDSSCAGALAGFDAWIISNNPSSVSNAVLYKDLKNQQLLKSTKEGMHEKIYMYGSKTTNPSSLALADLRPPISSSHKR